MIAAEEKYSCEKDTAVVYKIRMADRSAWAVIAMRQWPRGGSIDIQSDFGNYAYSWNATGDGDFRAFLLDLHYDYFMGKVRQGFGHGEVFDPEGSLDEIKRDIIKARRTGDINKAAAREAWDDLSWVDATDETVFATQITAYGSITRIYDDDYSAIPFMRKRDPQCAGFWEVIWPVACEIWREELAAEGVTV